MHYKQIRTLRKLFKGMAAPGTLQIDGCVWDSDGNVVWVGGEQKYTTHSFKLPGGKPKTHLWLFPVAQGYVYRLNLICKNTGKPQSHQVECTRLTKHKKQGTRNLDSSRFYFRTEFSFKQEEPAIATN